VESDARGEHRGPDRGCFRLARSRHRPQRRRTEDARRPRSGSWRAAEDPHAADRRRRKQFIFKYHAEREIRNSAGKLGTGIDIRGEGGYVVVAPSIHASGKTYRWAAGCALGEIELAELPAKWFELLTASRRSDKTIGNGERNVRLTSVAGGMRRVGADEKEIRADLKIVNDEQCDPPLPVDEVETIASSVARYEPAHHLTDSGNAKRLSEIAAGKLLYHYALGWLRWDGRVWRRDQAGRVYQEAKRLIKMMHREAFALPEDPAFIDLRKRLSKHAFKSESRSGLEATPTAPVGSATTSDQ
jgi:hypothetical protein